MMLILFLSHYLWAQDPLLEGVWRQDCLNQAVRTEHFQGPKVSLMERYYGDKSCTQSVLDFASSGTFKAEAGKIDFAFQQITITPQNSSTVRDYNRRHVCGISTWTLGKPENVTGRFCEIFGNGMGLQIPPAGQMRFGIYKIEKDLLYFGRMNPDQDSSSPDKRPTEFDGRYYKRRPTFAFRSP